MMCFFHAPRVYVEAEVAWQFTELGASLPWPDITSRMDI
jgi:hypothetical protein